MKTYKNGISLIVLVITILVLAILATTVIISLSNTNIISEANTAAAKSDMANLKTAYELYVASELIENKDYDRTSLNLTAASDANKFTEIFGDNVPDKYKNNLEIVAGRLVYKTAESELVSVLKELNMAITVIPTDLTIGDTVVYTPTADPEGTYSGATYIKDTDQESDTYNTYIESTTNYTPGEMTWVYLGQDESGNALLTSQESTKFIMKVYGQDGFVTGPDRMDTLCNTLYGNNTYGQARNMKIEDVNRVLGYPGETGYLGRYYNKSAREIKILTSKTIGEVETELGATITDRNTPRLSTTVFEDYLLNYYNYTGTTYKDNTTNEYNVIFRKRYGNSTATSTSCYGYWLSSQGVDATFANNSRARFYLRSVTLLDVQMEQMFYTNNENGDGSLALRPVIVLNSNVQFGEETDDGWTLEIM